MLNLTKLISLAKYEEKQFDSYAIFILLPSLI